ncbi:T9SS type A sorting domain-containing protein [Mesonia sp.]|uniref:T9SS type A sorting domain-containing protein n=1 Tax=Mesonia sp. TaxID=1960830 RepID=UPI003F9E430B
MKKIILLCVTTLAATLMWTPGHAQDCQNSSKYPTSAVTPNADGSSTDISTCQYWTEYAEIGGITNGYEYEFTSDKSGTQGYITIREGTSDGTVVAQGFSPLQYTAGSSANLFPHYTEDAACITATDCSITTVSCVTCATAPDCEGVPGGPAQPGTACDDGDSNTVNDTYDENCNCAGIVPGPGADCSNAIAVVCNAGPETYTSVGSVATNTTDCFLGNSGLWFSFVGTGGDITVNSSATFDHEMSINSGSCGSLVNIDCDDQSINDEEYTISASVDGEMYYVYIARYNSGSTTTGDITIEIDCAAPITCPAPTALATTSLSTTAAGIEWTAGDTETSWNISWGTPGYTPGDVDEVDNDTSATESYQITGLTTNTDYEFYVQADCGGDQSSWSGPVTFTTTCAAVSDFSEDFEATTGSDLPNCWAKVGTSGTTDTRANTGISGARVLYMYDGVTVALPPVDNAAANTHQMSMKVRGNFSSGETIEFGYLLDSSDETSFVLISSIETDSNTTPQEFAAIPTGMPSGDVVFALRTIGAISVLIDDVSWELAPACPNPTGLAVDNIGETSVDIAWDVTNTAQYWNLIVREADGGAYQPSQGDITEEDLESSPYTKTGLTPNTDYEVYIVADCDMDLSNFVGPVTFTTLATPPDNDDICDATALTVDADCSGNTYTNTGSTFQTGEPRGDCFNSFTESETTVWFTFVAPASGNVTVTTDIEGTTLTDTELAIYKAPSDCTDASTVGEQVGCDQDGGDIVGSGFTSVATLVGLTEGDTYYVQIAGYSNSEGDFCIEVNDAGCIAPADLSVDNITENSADFSWTTSATQSDIYVVESSEPAPDENSTPTDTGVTSPTSLDNLTTNMAYDAYVRSDCGADGVSDWVGPKTFTTLVAPPDNDDCSDAIELVCGQSITGTTLGATASGLSATCGSYTSSSALDVFYSFEADGTSDYTVSLDAASGNSFDGILFVYSDVCGSLTSLGCSDGGNPEEMTLTAPAAGTYTVRLFRYAGTGNYTLGLECTSAISGYVYESGAWTPMDPNGNATASDNIVVIDGEASFTSDMEVNNITVNSGATLNVESVLTINGDITNNGDMIFKSTATSDGELAAVPASSSITGEFTVERYTSADRAYRFVSSPVTTSASIHANWQEGATSATDNPVPGFGTHITGSTTDQQNGFDGTVTGNPSLFTLDAANQDFAAVANTDVNTITAGEGYLLFVRGDRSIDLTTNASAGASVLRSRGALHIGDLTQTSNLSSVANEFNLIANPYQSAIDITSVIANSQNLNANYCYVYDPSLGVNGAYVTVDLSNGSNGASSQANQYVQPGQAVQVATDSNGTTSVLFSEADKAPGNHTSTFRAESLVNANGFIKTQLYTTENYVAGAKLHDNFMIHFSSAYNNVLNSEDAVKAFNFTENMGTGSLGAVYSIERREMPVDAEEIQLFTDNYEHQGYTLLVETGNLGEAKAYFVDSFTEEEVALVEGENLINFNVDLDSEQSKATDRFYLRFEEQGLFTDSSVLDHSLQLYPNPTTIESGFYLSSSLWKDQQVSISVRDLLGREVYSAQEVFTNGKIHVSPGNSLGNGTYFVEVKQGDQRIVKRFITK